MPRGPAKTLIQGRLLCGPEVETVVARITEQGDKVRALKSNKAAKVGRWYYSFVAVK